MGGSSLILTGADYQLSLMVLLQKLPVIEPLAVPVWLLNCMFELSVPAMGQLNPPPVIDRWDASNPKEPLPVVSEEELHTIKGAL